MYRRGLLSAVPAVGLWGLCPSSAQATGRVTEALHLHALRADPGAIQRVQILATCMGEGAGLPQRWALHLGPPNQDGRHLWSLDRRGIGYCSRPLQQTLGPPTGSLVLTLVEEGSTGPAQRTRLELRSAGLYLLSTQPFAQLPPAWRATPTDTFSDLLQATSGGAFDALLLSLC